MNGASVTADPSVDAKALLQRGSIQGNADWVPPMTRARLRQGMRGANRRPVTLAGPATFPCRARRSRCVGS
jgi:hypothetical protein